MSLDRRVALSNFCSIGCAAVIMAVSISATDTQREGECGGYASQSVGLIQTLRTLGCDYNEGDLQAKPHFDYCMAVNPFRPPIAIAEREAAVAACRERKARERECEGFADRMIGMVSQARSLGCGQDWATDRGPYMAGCMGTYDLHRYKGELLGRELNIRACADQQRKREFCQSYAAQAVSTMQGVESSCNLNDGYFDRNPQAHFDFCMGVDRYRTDVANAERAAAINRCRNPKAKADCESYAQTTVAQINEANSLDCRHNWDPNPAAHLNWCKGGVDPGAIQVAIADRESHLARCRDFAKKKDTCASFAKTTMGLVEQAAGLGCKFNWDTRYESHYGWCLDGDEFRPTQAIADKNNMLQGCRDLNEKKAFCRQYGAQAAAQAQQALGLRCGFNWVPEAEWHYGWCLDGDLHRTKVATVERAQNIKACQAK
jgi:hypothetical protein